MISTEKQISILVKCASKAKTKKVVSDVNSGIGKNNKFGEKDWSKQEEHMQIPNRRGPGVWRSKCSMSACHTRCK